MENIKQWAEYLSNLQVGDEVEIEHLEFAFAPGNTVDRILCLNKSEEDKYLLSVEEPVILAPAEMYPDREEYEDGINGEDVRMQLGQNLVGYDKNKHGGEQNICLFQRVDDPRVTEYLQKNGWGNLKLHEINLPDEFGGAWNL